MPGQVSRNTGAQSETLRYQQTFTIRYPLRNAKCDIADQTKSQQRAKINGEGSTWSIWIEPSTPRTDCPAAGSAIQKWGSSGKKQFSRRLPRLEGEDYLANRADRPH